MSNRLTKFLTAQRYSRWLLVEAAFALGASRLALILLPFRRIAGRLGRVGVESSVSIPTSHESIAEQVGWAVETMARHLPWQSRCLGQALSAWWMLGRRGVVGTVYFGVARNPDKPFDAHAWLRCGSRIVTGGNGHEQFQVISCFSHSKSATSASKQ